MTWGEIFQDFRRIHNVSTQEASRELGIDEEHYILIENGNYELPNELIKKAACMVAFGLSHRD